MRRSRNTGGPIRTPLGGLLICGACGKVLHSHTRGNNGHVYRCSTRALGRICPDPQCIHANIVLEQIAEAARQIAADGIIDLGLRTTAGASDTEAELRRPEMRHSRLLERFNAGPIELVGFEERSARHQRRRDGLEVRAKAQAAPVGEVDTERVADLMAMPTYQLALGAWLRRNLDP